MTLRSTHFREVGLGHGEASTNALDNDDLFELLGGDADRVHLVAGSRKALRGSTGMLDPGFPHTFKRTKLRLRSCPYRLADRRLQVYALGLNRRDTPRA